MSRIPIKTIERLSIYKRILKTELVKGKEYIFSHKLASLSNKKSTQVRRDLMFLSQIASTQKGYKVKTLIENIEEVLGCTDSQKTALVGIGNIGRALISYFYGKGGYLSITTAFDTDETKINRVIGGCKCYHINDMEEIIKKENISIGIIAVPESDAQKTADALIISGVVGLINVTTTPIKISKNVYIENIDFTTAFEKTAYNVKMIKNKLNENNFMQNTIKNKL